MNKAIGTCLGLVLLLVLGFVSCFVAGCIGPSADRPSRAEQVERVPWPPMPPVPIMAVAGPEEPLAAAVPQAPLALHWEPSPDHDKLAHYNVWMTTNLYEPFQVVAETMELTWPLDLSQPRGFFKVNCTGTNGLESDFARKWQ